MTAKIVLEYFMKYGVSVWLGIMPSVLLGIAITEWKWWAIVVPIQLLNGISRYAFGLKF